MTKRNFAQDFAVVEKLTLQKCQNIAFPYNQEMKIAFEKFYKFFKIVTFSNELELIISTDIKRKCILIYNDTNVCLTPCVELDNID